MSDVDVSEAAMQMGVAILRRIGKEWWHRIRACSCDNGWILPGTPCEIGLEEIEAYKAARLFAEWDALGLGYIGPRLNEA